jgi:hypothetical protein
MTRPAKPKPFKITLPSIGAKALKITGLKFDNVVINGKKCTVIILPQDNLKLEEVTFEEEK